MIELHVDHGSFQPANVQMPHASRLAREQARREQPITSGQHVSVTLGELDRRLLCEFDGTRTRDAIEGVIQQWIDNGEIQLQSARGRQIDGDTVSAALANTLGRLSRLGLLTEPAAVRKLSL